VIIQRDGKTYELTEKELRQAYKEQEHIYDVNEILEYIDQWPDYLENATKIEIESIKGKIDYIAYGMREIYYKYEHCTLEDAMEQAIKEYLSDFRRIRTNYYIR